MNLQFKHLLRTTDFWNFSWQILMWKESLQVRTPNRMCFHDKCKALKHEAKDCVFFTSQTHSCCRSHLPELSISACPPKIQRTMRITCVRWIVKRFKNRRQSFFLSIRVTTRNTWYSLYLALYGTMIWTMWYEKKANYAPYRCIKKAFERPQPAFHNKTSKSVVENVLELLSEEKKI